MIVECSEVFGIASILGCWSSLIVLLPGVVGRKTVERPENLRGLRIDGWAPKLPDSQELEAVLLRRFLLSCAGGDESEFLEPSKIIWEGLSFFQTILGNGSGQGNDIA